MNADPHLRKITKNEPKSARKSEGGRQKIEEMFNINIKKILSDLRKGCQIICRGRDARLSVEEGMPDYL